MTMRNDDWHELARTWTQAEPDAPDIDARLIAAVRRRDTFARLNFAGEIAICLAALAFLAWAVAARKMASMPAAAALGFIIFAAGMTFWSRWTAPDCLTDTPGRALRTAALQARNGRRWAWAGLAVCAAATVYLAVTALTAMPRSAEAGGVLWGGAAFIATWAVIYVRHAYVAGRRLAACDRALAAMDENKD